MKTSLFVFRHKIRDPESVPPESRYWRPLSVYLFSFLESSGFKLCLQEVFVGQLKAGPESMNKNRPAYFCDI